MRPTLGSWALTIMVFYKHANPPDLGKNYHFHYPKPEKSYVYRTKQIKIYATHAGVVGSNSQCFLIE